MEWKGVGWKWGQGGVVSLAGGDGEEADATMRVGGVGKYVDLCVGRAGSADGGCWGAVGDGKECGSGGGGGGGRGGRGLVGTAGEARGGVWR